MQNEFTIYVAVAHAVFTPRGHAAINQDRGLIMIGVHSGEIVGLSLV